MADIANWGRFLLNKNRPRLPLKVRCCILYGNRIKMNRETEKMSEKNVSENNGSENNGAVNAVSEIDRLKDIVVALRAENGCPWDRAQTHGSLKTTVVEEAAEVVCGINILDKTGDPENLKEELGDLLLQVMFHAVMAEEEGLFTLEDVARTASEKMIRRHPHVFSGVEFASDEERHKSWEEIKKAEKEGKEWQEPYLAAAMNEAEELIRVAQRRKGFISS